MSSYKNNLARKFSFMTCHYAAQEAGEPRDQGSYLSVPAKRGSVQVRLSPSVTV
jgi:hypothetical protein